MILKNTIVTFTVTIPEIEVDKDLGLSIARNRLLFNAEGLIAHALTKDSTTPEKVAESLIYGKGKLIKLDNIEVHIKDCPDYPALCD